MRRPLLRDTETSISKIKAAGKMSDCPAQPCAVLLCERDRSGIQLFRPSDAHQQHPQAAYKLGSPGLLFLIEAAELEEACKFTGQTIDDAVYLIDVRPYRDLDISTSGHDAPRPLQFP